MGKRGKRSRGGAGGRRVPRAKNVFGEAARKLPLAQPPSLHRAGQDHNHRRVGGEVDLQEDRPCGGLQVHHHAGEVPEAVALRGQTHPWPHQGGGLHHLRVGRGVHPVSPQEPAHGGPQAAPPGGHAHQEVLHPAGEDPSEDLYLPSRRRGAWRWR